MMIQKLMLIKRLDKAIVNNDYDTATKVSYKLQDIAFRCYVKHKSIPLWVKKCLALYNDTFGWIKMDVGDWEDWK